MSTTTAPAVTKAKPKMYVLVKELDGVAPIYQRINQQQRVRLVKRPWDHAYGKLTIAHKETGVQKNIRLKIGCPTIDQDVQIDKFKIGANESHTSGEKKLLEFKNAVLITSSPIVQEFLETSPQFKNSLYESVGEPAVPVMYELVDKAAEARVNNQETKKRIQAANKIFDLDVKEAGELLQRVNGHYFDLPKEESEADQLATLQNMLMEWLDNTNEAGVDKILSDNISVEEEVMILVGELEAKKILSFDLVPDHVVLITKDSEPRKLKKIVNDFDRGERLQLFQDFLISDQGSLILEDLQKLNGKTKKEEKKAAKPDKNKEAKAE